MIPERLLLILRRYAIKSIFHTFSPPPPIWNCHLSSVICHDWKALEKAWKLMLFAPKKHTEKLAYLTDFSYLCISNARAEDIVLQVAT